MTFGYSSQLRDRSNISGVKDWADDLLTQVGWVRKTEKVRLGLETTFAILLLFADDLDETLITIPTGEITADHLRLPFARRHCCKRSRLPAWRHISKKKRLFKSIQAMIRLNSHPEKYTGIDIKQCGLLFLGVPHSGTDQADWNNFVSGIASIFGVRMEIVEALRSFNGFGVESKEAFKSIAQQPPYFCLCETRQIDIAPGQSRLVSFHIVVFVPYHALTRDQGCYQRLRRLEWRRGISSARL
jgi:hypothetical protein